MENKNLNNFSLDHTHNWQHMKKKKMIEKNEDSILENRRNKFKSNKLELDNLKKKFIYGNVPKENQIKTKLSRSPFFLNLKEKNIASNFQQTNEFLDNVYKPQLKKEDNLKSSSKAKLLPPIKNMSKKLNFLEKSISSKNNQKLPQIQLHRKNISIFENQQISHKHERDFSNTLFLTSNNDNLNIFPNKDLRDDLFASMQNMQRMLKTPIRQDRYKKLFHRIYNQDENFLNNIKKGKKDKANFTLMQYQDNLMNLISSRMSSENLRSLSINLKKVREKNETVQPLKINWNEYNKLLENLNKLKTKNYKAMKLSLSRNKSVDYIIDTRENQEKEKEKLLDWSDIDVSKIILRSSSQRDNGDKSRIRMKNKLTAMIERISPYVPDYLLQKFMEI